MEVTEEDKARDVEYQESADEAPELNLFWEQDALDKVKRIPIPFIRNMAIKRIEEEVDKEGKTEVTLELFNKHRFNF